MPQDANISIICAMARNGVIGRDNGLPWHLPEDLKHFKRTTMGHPIVMGRRTWESIDRPLPGRHNIVVSRNPAFQAEGAQVADSLSAALTLCQQYAAEPFIIGGASLYEAALPIARHFHLTRIHADVQGDTVLKGFNESEWQEVSRQDFDGEPYDYSICLLERKVAFSAAALGGAAGTV